MDNYQRFAEAMESLKQALSKARDEFPYSRTQLEIIIHLYKSGSLSTSELSKLLGLTPGAVTQTVETLTKKGLVERTTDSDDRRVINHSLSAAGRKLAEQLKARRKQQIQALLDELSPLEREILIVAVDKLAKLVDKHNTK